MSDQAVPLSHVLHVLPPSSSARLNDLCRRGVRVECHMDSAGHRPRAWLVASLGGQTVRTSDHPWIAPALVQELLVLTARLLP